MSDTDDMLSNSTVEFRREEMEHALGRHVDTPRSTERYRLFKNADGTLLVRFWKNGNVETATRGNVWDTWGPPMVLFEEKP